MNTETATRLALRIVRAAVALLPKRCDASGSYRGTEFWNTATQRMERAVIGGCCERIIEDEFAAFDGLPICAPVAS